VTTPFLQKAETGVRSAKLLLEAGDTDGACSRAYYAMYDAARATLAWAGVAPERGEFRSHHGLISAFGLHLVKPGLFPVEVGKAFQNVQALRQIADYEAIPVSLEMAGQALTAAQIFVETAASITAKPFHDPAAGVAR
jgi:uncharacterized protein (UPF0332 family)